MFQNDKIGIGVIGVGSRGRGIVKTVLGIDHMNELHETDGLHLSAKG